MNHRISVCFGIVDDTRYPLYLYHIILLSGVDFVEFDCRDTVPSSTTCVKS